MMWRCLRVHGAKPNQATEPELIGLKLKALVRMRVIPINHQLGSHSRINQFGFEFHFDRWPLEKRGLFYLNSTENDMKEEFEQRKWMNISMTTVSFGI